jgi:hypothetical protein
MHLARSEGPRGIAGINRPRFEVTKRTTPRPQHSAFANRYSRTNKRFRRDPGLRTYRNRPRHGLKMRVVNIVSCRAEMRAL